MLTSMTERQMIKAYVRPEAKQIAEDFVGRTGMSQQEVFSRLLEWFGEQDPVIQHTVMGLLPDGYESDLARIILKRLSDEETSPPGKGDVPPPEQRLVIHGPNKPRANPAPKKRSRRK